MLVLGLLFILGAGAVTAGVMYDGGEDATVELFGTTVNTTIAGVYGVGLLAGLLFLLGLWMIVAGTARSRRKRVERRQARARHRDSVAEMEQERAKLRAENEQLHERLARGDSAAPGTGSPGLDRPERPSDAGSDSGYTPGNTPGTTTETWRPDDSDPSTRASGSDPVDTEAGRRREGV